MMYKKAFGVRYVKGHPFFLYSNQYQFAKCYSFYLTSK